MTESRPTARPPAWATDPVPPPLHAVAQAIAAGETWLFAWTLQSTVSYRFLPRECRIHEMRLLEIELGAGVTREELGMLAKAWKVTPADVMLTLPPGTVLPDPPPPTPPEDPVPPAESAIA